MDGSPIMERLRAKYAAMEKASVAKKKRKSKR
jgi:hypothetical protein